jgi:hypothetical protein
VCSGDRTMELVSALCESRVAVLWHGEGSETHEGEHPLLEAGTRGLVKG